MMSHSTIRPRSNHTNSNSNNNNSAAVVLLSNNDDDIMNDFMNPSQACTNPLFTTTTPTTSKVGNNSNHDNHHVNHTDPTAMKIIPKKRRARPQIRNETSNMMTMMPSSTSFPLQLSSSLPSIINAPTANHSNAMKNQGTITAQSSEQIVDEDSTMEFATSSHTVKEEAPQSTLSSMSVSHNDETQSNHRSNKNNNNNDIVKATLSDCLACSGCVTTAETVFMEEQHSLDVLRKLMMMPLTTRTTSSLTTNNNHTDHYPHIVTQQFSDHDIIKRRRKPVVLTISPASWADICRHSDFIPDKKQQQQQPSSTTQQEQLFQQFTTLLHEMWNVLIVVDGNVSLSWSLYYSAQEFCQAYKEQLISKKNHVSKKALQSPYPSMAISSTRSHVLLPNGTIETIEYNDNDSYTHKEHNYDVHHQDSNHGNDDTSPIIKSYYQLPTLPIISSSCPATVCYIEKTIPSAVPHLQSIKSSMSLFGTYFRRQDDHDDILHVAIMPCHDKKLEASRKDFYRDNNQQKQKQKPDIDIVITTTECIILIQEYIQRIMEAEKKQSSMTTEEPEQQDTTNFHDVVYRYIQSRKLSHILRYDEEHLNDVNDTKKMDLRSHHNEDDMEIEVLVNGTNKSSNRNSNNNMSQPPSWEAKLDHIWKKYEAASSTYDDIPVSSSFIPTLITTKPNVIGASSCNRLPDEIISRSDSHKNKSFFLYGSGGYADYIFRYAAYHLFGYTINPNDHDNLWKPFYHHDNPSITKKRVSARIAAIQKHADYYHATLYRCHIKNDHDRYSNNYHIPKNHNNHGFTYTLTPTPADGAIPVLRFVIAYGMQTLQRAFETFHTSNTSHVFDYIEAMACPSGCINGGGQIRLHSHHHKQQTKSNTTATTTTTSDGRMDIDRNTDDDKARNVTSITNFYDNGHSILVTERETPNESRIRILSTQQYFHKNILLSERMDLLPNKNKSSPILDTIIITGDDDMNIVSSDQNNQQQIETSAASPMLSLLPTKKLSIHTRYHVVPPLQYRFGAAAGLSVKDTQW